MRSATEILAAACASGLGKVTAQVDLLKAIGQLLMDRP